MIGCKEFALCVVLLWNFSAVAVGQVFQCVDCTNYIGDTYYSSCPQNTTIGDFQKVGLFECDGACFTKSDRENPQRVIRGCTTNRPSLPSPLPPEDGCYEWNGEVWCLCKGFYCNYIAMGDSNGIALDAHIVNVGSANGTDDDGPLQCYQCTNLFDGKEYPQCSMDKRVNNAYAANCTGVCITRTFRNNPLKVARSCSSELYGLPKPLPPDGCYDEFGETWCVCRNSYCNGEALGTSSGVALDAHLSTMNGIDPSEEEDGIKRCYSCVGYLNATHPNTGCPKNARVRRTAYLAKCNGTCFTRSFTDNPNNVARGCTDTQYGLPVPLPKAGCYDRDGQTWCLCNGSRCNGNAIGKSNGVDLYQHLDDIEDDFKELDGKKRCYNCVNYADGKFYPQCPKDKRVRNAYLQECNGTCFTHSEDFDDRLVSRGCTDTLYKFVNPLPPDGCYTYYSAVYCICSKSRCNGRALGKPQPIELDAHLQGNMGTAVTSLKGRDWLIRLSAAVLLTIATRRWLMSGCSSM